MPPPHRDPRIGAPPRIDCAESTGYPYFLHSRFGEERYWTEGRDLAVMAEAARNGGVVTTSTLRTCGFSKPAITAAVRRGLLTRWGRGVYLVGPPTDDLAEARAAALAVPHGTLGFAVAAQLAQFGPVVLRPLDVIVAPGRRADREGLAMHRMDLRRRDVTRYEGLRCTTPAVTVVHLARVLPQLPLERAVQEAFAKRIADTRRLEQALERHRGGRGTRRLWRMLELGVDDLRSRAERALRRCVHQAGLPLPIFNAEVGPWRVDALWRDERLAVEVNGFAAHSSPWAHDRDHRKEQYLLSAGYTTRRFTALQAIDEPMLVIAGVAAALAQKR